VQELLLALAQYVYYDKELYSACITVCGALQCIASDDAEAAALVAFSMNRTGDHSSAVGAFRRAIELTPDRAGLHTGLTKALAALDRLEEAVESQSRAIELNGDEATYRLTRGNLYQALGNHTAAIAEYEHVLDSLNRADAPAGPVPVESATLTQYLRDLPHQKVAALAALARLRSLAEVGPWERVTEESQALLESADQSTRRAIHCILGDALRNAGRGKQACHAYAQAVAAGDDSVETRTTLCALLVECGRVDEAVRELALLADPAEPSAEPVAALDALTAVLDRFPSHRGALRARGLAEYATGRPASAVATLSQVLDRHPRDGWALLWRGLARTSHSNETDPVEAGWNDSFSLGRIHDALLDLTEAARLDGVHQERARKAFGWLLERCMWSPPLRDSLMSNVPAMIYLTAALPGLNEPFKELYESHAQDNPARRWTQAAAKLANARSGMEALGLPLLAALTDALRADSLIRLHRLQEALDALKKARNAIPLMVLDPDQLVDGYMHMMTRNARNEGSDVVLLPYETLELGVHLTAEALTLLQQVTADATAMLGDSDGALVQASAVPSTSHKSNGTRAVMQRATLLRDAGRHDEALAALESLSHEALDQDEEVWCRNLQVTILSSSQRFDEARRIAERTLDQIPEEFTYQRSVLQANMSWILIVQGQPQEALTLLDSMEFGPQFTWQQRKTWHHLRALSLAELGEPLTALAEFRTALSIAEEFRQTLQGLDARISWQAEHLTLYSHAMACSLEANDINALFELLEQSKAQAFLDQLDAGRMALDDTTEELRDYLEQARARRAILRELEGVTQPAAEIELLHAYERKGGTWSSKGDDRTERAVPVTSSLIRQRLEVEAAAVSRLESRYDEALMVGHQATVDRVMGAPEIGEQLRLLGEERTLLVEYLVTEQEVIVFFLRAGQTVPQMERIAMRESELAELVDKLLPPAVGESDRPLASHVLKQLTPLVAPVLQHSCPNDVLWIVPHQLLHRVPLHAIPVDGAPLLRTRSFCYTPSAAVLSRCQRARTARLADSTSADSAGTERGARWTSALVLGDSLSDLPHSRFEAKEVAARFGTRALVGSAAKTSAVLERVAHPHCPDVLHLACHGRFDRERPLDSGLVLAPEAGALGEEVVLTAEAVMRLPLSTDLVVLSACDSGRNKERPGDELIGLARAWLQAGAPSVLVSLWPVHDLSTCLLMEQFYRRAAGPRADGNLADALRHAQLAVADLTAEEVIAYCDRRIGETTGVESTLLQLDRADIQILAGDLASAVSAHRAIVEQSSTTTSAVVRRIAAAVERKLPLLQLRAMTPEQIDYSIQPFSDPYYWASFVLVGDWR
jgi:CHAT domain-containing protein/predicted Zn-dependent protease